MTTTAFSNSWKRLALVLAFVFLAFPSAAQTTTSASSDPATIQRLIDDAQKSGAKIVVIETTGPVATTAGQTLMVPSLADRVETDAFAFRDRLVAILNGASGFAGETVTTLRKVDSENSLIWIPPHHVLHEHSSISRLRRRKAVPQLAPGPISRTCSIPSRRAARRRSAICY